MYLCTAHAPVNVGDGICMLAALPGILVNQPAVQTDQQARRNRHASIMTCIELAHPSMAGCRPCRSTCDPGDEMSDLYIRVIPTNPQWQPAAEAAARAVEYLAGLFTGKGDRVWEVTSKFYDQVTLIDGGEYMQDLFCPRCDAAIGLDWFWDLLIARNGGRRVGEPTIGDLGGGGSACLWASVLAELLV